MIDFETIRTIVLITLIAIVATLLRRRAGFDCSVGVCSRFLYRSKDNQDASDEAIHTAKLTGDEERRCIV
jgi:hypothetical protein